MKRIVNKIDLKYVVIVLSLVLVVILCIGFARSKRYNNVNKVVVSNNTTVEKKNNYGEIALSEVIINSIDGTIISEIENNDVDKEREQNVKKDVKENIKESNSNDNSNNNTNNNNIGIKEETWIGVESFEFNTINVKNGVIIRTMIVGTYNIETHIIDSFTITIKYDYTNLGISQEELEQNKLEKEVEIGKVLGVEINTEISNNSDEKCFYIKIKDNINELKENYPAEFTDKGLFYYGNFKRELSNVNYDGDSWKQLLK